MKTKEELTEWINKNQELYAKFVFPLIKDVKSGEELQMNGEVALCSISNEDIRDFCNFMVGAFVLNTKALAKERQLIDHLRNSIK